MSCVRASEDAITCSDYCQKETLQSAALISRTYGSFNTTAMIMRSLAILFVVMAIVTIGLPFMNFFYGLKSIFWPIGFACILGAWSCFRAAKRYGTIDKKRPNKKINSDHK